MGSYRDFLDRKHLRHRQSGFDVPLESVNTNLKHWQKLGVQWSLRVGRSLLSWECGLGKTIAQLEWSRHVCEHAGGPVLLLCPLAVQRQTLHEAEKFAIASPIRITETQADCGDGINIANYEKLHHFDATKFAGVVLDESSILKSFTGKTKQQLCRSFENTLYKLCCTATPAPNDRMEIGNHAEFLGIMPSNEMLARWFINSGDAVGAYRLRKHGEKDFWRWVSSWAQCLSSPADIGFDDAGYDLPSLDVQEHVCEIHPEPGFLFPGTQPISATEVHREKRAYLAERADIVAKLVNDSRESWVVWCDTDYEADSLTERITDAVEVRGSDTTAFKEAAVEWFVGRICRCQLAAVCGGKKIQRRRETGDDVSGCTCGGIRPDRKLISKSEIFGFGLNFQHCHHMTWFAGYSYERWYQAVRRLWRFGQSREVTCHIVRSENEGSILDTIRRKESEHQEMQTEVARLMRDGMLEELGLTKTLKKYEPKKRMALPPFLAKEQLV